MDAELQQMLLMLSILCTILSIITILLLIVNLTQHRHKKKKLTSQQKYWHELKICQEQGYSLYLNNMFCENVNIASLNPDAWNVQIYDQQGAICLFEKVPRLPI